MNFVFVILGETGVSAAKLRRGRNIPTLKSVEAHDVILGRILGTEGPYSARHPPAAWPRIVRAMPGSMNTALTVITPLCRIGYFSYCPQSFASSDLESAH
jgi:hypothetical protein